MSSQKLIFTDAAHMSWVLTIHQNAKAITLETNFEPNGICITATNAQLTFDETSTLSPFVLKLDDNTSVWLTDDSATQVDEFLQAHNIQETVEAA
jgi:hypothetical protein